MNEEVTVGDGGGAVNIQKDVPLMATPCGKAFGCNYFTAPDIDTYTKVRLGRNKYQRWDSFTGKGDWSKGIRNYATKNPKGSLLVKHPTQNSFMHLRR